MEEHAPIMQVMPKEPLRYPNDCWAIALSLALEKDYAEMRATMKPFISSTGRLAAGFVSGVLENNGFESLEPDPMPLREALQIIDDLHNRVVFITHDHICFSQNKIVFDDKPGLLNEIVLVIFYKAKTSEDYVSNPM